MVVELKLASKAGKSKTMAWQPSSCISQKGHDLTPTFLFRLTFYHSPLTSSATGFAWTPPRSPHGSSLQPPKSHHHGFTRRPHELWLPLGRRTGLGTAGHSSLGAARPDRQVCGGRQMHSSTPWSLREWPLTPGPSGDSLGL